MDDEKLLQLVSELSRHDRGFSAACLYWALRDIHALPKTLSPPASPPRIILFGARETGKFAATFLKRMNAAEIACFFDLDPNRWGTLLEGIEIRKPDAEEVRRAEGVVISTLYVPDIADALSALGVAQEKTCPDAASFLVRFRPDLLSGLRDPERLLARLEVPFLKS